MEDSSPSGTLSNYVSNGEFHTHKTNYNGYKKKCQKHNNIIFLNQASGAVHYIAAVAFKRLKLGIVHVVYILQIATQLNIDK